MLALISDNDNGRNDGFDVIDSHIAYISSLNFSAACRSGRRCCLWSRITRAMSVGLEHVHHDEKCEDMVLLK